MSKTNLKTAFALCLAALTFATGSVSAEPLAAPGFVGTDDLLVHASGPQASPLVGGCHAVTYMVCRVGGDGHQYCSEAVRWICDG